MRSFLFFLATLFAINFPSPANSKPSDGDDKVRSYSEAGADLLFHPAPKYPFIGLHKIHQGNGSYLIAFDRDRGTVRAVTILRSAGSNDLDEAVTATLRQWRARPHTLEKVIVPVSFSLAGEKELQILNQVGDNLRYSPYPQFPLSARWEHPSGRGVFRLQIDRKSGLVTSVQMLQTMGDSRLNAAALQTLRTWRFKPQTLSELTVPIEF